MFQSIYVPVDNSEHSNASELLGVELAGAFSAKLTGSHIYAAALHDTRFKQMEFTLPDEYKEEGELEKQRRIHDALITRGLELISDSYLDRLAGMAESAGVEFAKLRADGRTFEEIVREIEEHGFDLVIMGAVGQGAVRQSTAGSVTERTMRRIEKDTLIIRDPEVASLSAEGHIVVALDGSQRSWGALQTALELAHKSGGRTVEVVAVSNGDAAEELLESHLRLARATVRGAGLKARTTLLDGEPGPALLEHLAETNPWLVVAGRTGLDASDGELEVGSVTWELVRRASCNVFVSVANWTAAQARDAAAR
jgi:nucleotide-binding universal stress UspA family protein